MKRLAMFGIAGEMLAGKSTAAKFLLDHFNVKQITISTVLNDALGVLDLPLTRENQQNLAKLLREQFGDQVLGESVAAVAEQIKDKMVLIDGIRKPAELEELKKKFKNFKLIFIKAPLETRYDRLQNRGEKVGESMKTFEQFRASHSAESEIDIRKLEEMADFTIENAGGEDELFTQLTKLVSETL